jgi:hypothetical protein
MKKIILFAAFLFTMNVSVNAENDAVNNVEAYSINANINSLVRYLNLSSDQIESVENIQKIFEENLRYASFVTNDESRRKMVNNSIEFSTKNMSYILNEEQYKKYLTILNVTINNRHIK